MAIQSIEAYTFPSEDEISEAQPLWRVKGEGLTVLVHDVQRYFIDPYEQPLRSKLLTNIARIVQAARVAGYEVIYTAQPGGMTPVQRGLLFDVWGPGMDTEQAHTEIAHAVRPEQDERVFTKWRYSAFHGNDLWPHLQDRNCKELVVCGVYASVGILATCIESFSNDVRTFVPFDGIAGFDRVSHVSTCRYLNQNASAVLSTDSLITDILKEQGK
ncbi:isochorismatase family protein [Actinomyces sp. oral taxon 170]|jgi:probable isochorismatase|uniref:isochorismatase family protein n=1 Tax=Actinomyces sp. oral taxon 170 TaxID=712117 RepID=UPI0012F634A4|nr:isochorismatase family protein [Actinomyces sp. oral taxon 170]